MNTMYCGTPSKHRRRGELFCLVQPIAPVEKLLGFRWHTLNTTEPPWVGDVESIDGTLCLPSRYWIIFRAQRIQSSEEIIDPRQVNEETTSTSLPSMFLEP